MTVVDANVLLYAVNRAARHHHDSRAWLEGRFNDGQPVGLTWIVLLAFLRLATKPGLFPNPLPVADATRRVQRWLAHPAAVQLQPTSRHASVLSGLVNQAGTGGNLVSDAHLAALAIEHGAAVVSYDPDFQRFEGLEWHQPPNRSVG